MEFWVPAIRHLSTLVILTLGAACVYQWARDRTAAKGWAAAAFGSVSVLSVIWLISPGTESPRRDLAFKVMVACLVAFPWLLFRFTTALQPVRREIRWVIDGSSALAVVGTLLVPFIPAAGAPTPWWWDHYRVAVLLQWTVLFVYLAVRLWRASRGQPTVARRRMRTLAVASVLMNISVLLPPVPEGSVSGSALVRQLLTLAFGVLLFVGLTPPNWLLYVWRKKDYLRLQSVFGGVLRAESLEALGEVILPPCTDILGARGAALTDAQGLVIVAHGHIGSNDEPGVHSVPLSQGAVRFWMSPYAPFFVKSEMDQVQGFGILIDMAAQRCSLSDIRRESARELEFQATHDALTNLPNRTFLVDHLRSQLRSIAETGTAVCVQFLDLDRFKLVNDGINHSAGDALLISVAERLASTVREHDLVARFGGDEFVVVSRVEDDAEALNLAGRIAGGLAAPFWVSGRELRITSSIGLVVARDSSCDPDSVLRDADTAMYRAKAEGRSRIVLFDDAIRDDSEDRLELERGLRAAVSDGSLSLHYQPTVRLADGETIGVEALFRWNHPRLGLVHPGSAIALAEESDLIGAVGFWVLREACRQGREWFDQFPGLGEFRIWVNLSPAQFLHRNVKEDVHRALQESGLPPSHLGLEITESVFMEHTCKAAQTFEELRKLGVSIAIDDFGTGYSSLRSMQHFPADVLKIDGSFIAHVDEDTHDQAIVSACLAMADALGLTAVAEAVETQAQSNRLAEMGCSVAQGFYFSPPLPSAQMSRYIQNEIVRRAMTPVLTLAPIYRAS